MSQLVFIGCNETPDVFTLVEAHNASLLIEPNGRICNRLGSHYARNPFVKIVEAAIGTDDGIGTLTHYNSGLSSSLGQVTEQAKHVFSYENWEPEKTDPVAIMRLPELLKREQIERITTLIIDAQGMDSLILFTMADWLKEKRIERVTLEVNAAGFQHYQGLPNREADVINFMDEMPYRLVAREGLEFQPNLTYAVTNG